MAMRSFGQLLTLAPRGVVPRSIDRASRARIAARLDAGAAIKALALPPADRRSSWERVLRLVGGAGFALPKLPSRRGSGARVRLFRSFKLLGALKRAVPVLPLPLPWQRVVKRAELR